MPAWWPEEFEAMRNPDPRAIPEYLIREGAVEPPTQEPDQEHELD